MTPSGARDVSAGGRQRAPSASSSSSSRRPAGAARLRPPRLARQLPDFLGCWGARTAAARGGSLAPGRAPTCTRSPGQERPALRVGRRARRAAGVRGRRQDVRREVHAARADRRASRPTPTIPGHLVLATEERCSAPRTTASQWRPIVRAAGARLAWPAGEHAVPRRRRGQGHVSATRGPLRARRAGSGGSRHGGRRSTPATSTWRWRTARSWSRGTARGAGRRFTRHNPGELHHLMSHITVAK